MAFMTVGSHFVNLEKLCGIQAKRTSHPDKTIVTIHYEHESIEVWCDGDLTEITKQIYDALGNAYYIYAGPEGLGERRIETT